MLLVRSETKTWGKGKLQAANLLKTSTNAIHIVGNQIPNLKKISSVDFSGLSLVLGWGDGHNSDANWGTVQTSLPQMHFLTSQNHWEVQLVNTARPVSFIFPGFAFTENTRGASTDRITLPLLPVSGFFASRFLHLPRHACTCPKEEKPVTEVIPLSQAADNNLHLHVQSKTAFLAVS